MNFETVNCVTASDLLEREEERGMSKISDRGWRVTVKRGSANETGGFALYFAMAYNGGRYKEK